MFKRISSRISLTALFFIGIGLSQTMAQVSMTDSTKLNLKKAEELFLANNLQLIAQKYNIEKSKAEVITAKLFDNPEFSYENVFYNPETKKFFQTSSADGQGQYQIQVSQLIKLAGKRNKSIQLAKTGVKLAEYDFADLVRTLRYSLRTSFYSLHYKQRSVAVYDTEISSLKQLLTVYQAQLQKGNVAEKDVISIQSLLYTLQAEQADLFNDIEELQAELKQLTGINPSVNLIAEATDNRNSLLINSVAYSSLVDSALVNRPDLNSAKTSIDYATANQRLQKSMAVPDLTIVGTYDLQGSYIKNYNGLGVSFSLPFFNRNQGAVKQAGFDIKQAEVQSSLVDNQIKNELSKSYKNAMRLTQLNQSLDASFANNFDRLIDQVTKNFQKRNIGILEFLDFYDSYKTNNLQLNSMKADLVNSLEELNYLTATPFFNR